MQDAPTVLNVADGGAIEIRSIPDHYLDEVYSYLNYLKFRASEDKIQTDLANQSSLAKDWLRPKEDEAWKNL